MLKGLEDALWATTEALWSGSSESKSESESPFVTSKSICEFLSNAQTVCPAPARSKIVSQRTPTFC